jgi:hypothetical protein
VDPLSRECLFCTRAALVETNVRRDGVLRPLVLPSRVLMTYGRPVVNDAIDFDWTEILGTLGSRVGCQLQGLRAFPRYRARPQVSSVVPRIQRAMTPGAVHSKGVASLLSEAKVTVILSHVSK